MSLSVISVKSEKKQAKLNLNEMIKRTGQSSVPQIYINGKYIGGFMELKRYLETGRKSKRIIEKIYIKGLNRRKMN